eukprot:5635974-Pyramimonas_sp.AAC.1
MGARAGQGMLLLRNAALRSPLPPRQSGQEQCPDIRLPSPTTSRRRNAGTSISVPRQELQGRPEDLLALPHRRRARQRLPRQWQPHAPRGDLLRALRGNLLR